MRALTDGTKIGMRVARAGFRRAAVVAALMALVLCAAALPAQRGPGNGTGMHGSVGRGSGGRARGHPGHRGSRNGGWVDPYGYGGGWYDGGGYGEPMNESEGPEGMARPVIIAPPQPERIPSNPKVVEVAETKTKTETAKPLPAALFILSTGEKIETRHYLLSANWVQLTSERRQRSIPMDALDLKATLAANRERGLDLRIPTGGSEVSLGF